MSVFPDPDSQRAYATRCRSFRAIAMIVTILALSCGTPAPRSALPSDASRIVWSYEVHVTRELDVDVDATLENARPDTALRIDEDARPFLDPKEKRDGGRFVRYHVRLADAARKLDDVDVAYATDGVVFAPPSTWLMRPAGVPAIGRFRFHIDKPRDIVFATGIHPTPGKEDTYEGDVAALEDSSFAAFGALKVHRLPGTEIDVALARGLRVSEASVLSWLGNAAGAIARYFGARDRVVLFVAPGASDTTRGKTLGDGGAAVLFRLGTNVTDANVVEDWVAAHELVHVAMPTPPPEHAWFAEGMATYVEPVARARAGLLSEEKLWSDLVVGLPRGLPKPGDGGLDGANDPGRVYWGGAAYFFIADVTIRERSGGKRSLDDALRGIKRAGRNAEVHWPLARMLEEGDRATGLRVLSELYEMVARKPYAPDLEGLLGRLGVRHANGAVTYDDNARDARVRKAITAGLPAD
jgi:hypothetical protein